MAHELYGEFPIQNTFISTVVLVNEVSEVLQRHYPLSAILLTSLSIFAQLPTSRSNIFSMTALLAFLVTPNWFSKFCRQNGYLNSELMLSRAGETGGPGGTGLPGPHKFYLLGGTEGDPIFLKWALLTDMVLFFRQFAIFACTLWALLALGALFRKGPQDLVPPPRNSFLQAWC